jgi:RNA polymerase sigma-70 factor (ECF subfamily)
VSIDLSDADLLLRSRTSAEAFGEIYQRHADAVFRYLARRAGSGVAEDLLGDVFASAVEARLRATPHASGSALPWLYGIAKNVLRAHLRRRSAPGNTAGEYAMDWDAVDARLDAAGHREGLRIALAALSPAERDVLLLVAWEQLTVAEAAEALNITAVAARSRLHRARARAGSALLATPLQPDRQES